MRGPDLSCPHAEGTVGKPIGCRKSGMPCGFQYYRKCRGWWTLSENAGGCRLRKEEDHEKET